MLTCVDAITEHFQRRADCLRQRLTRPAHGTSEVRLLHVIYLRVTVSYEGPKACKHALS